jgi:hypothetical protein
MNTTRVPKPLVIHNTTSSVPAPKINNVVWSVEDGHTSINWVEKMTAVTPLHTPNKLIVNTSQIVEPVVKHRPKPAFTAVGFDINNIDPIVVPLIAKHGDFTSAEQARISYIINNDFKDALTKKADYSHAEQQAIYSQKSHEILLACLQNNVINETNKILEHILEIITGDGKVKPQHTSWENFFFKTDSSKEKRSFFYREKEEEIDPSTVINILNIATDKIHDKIPRIEAMISSLGDALFHTTQEYKLLKLYHIAGECKLELLSNVRVSQTATTDPLVLMRQVDDKHNYELFTRKVNSFKTLVEYITASLMQAQGLQNILESMLENIETMIDINIPAFKQQLLYANSFKSIKNSPVFVTQRTTLINNIKSVLEIKT